MSFGSRNSGPSWTDLYCDTEFLKENPSVDDYISCKENMFLLNSVTFYTFVTLFVMIFIGAFTQSKLATGAFAVVMIALRLIYYVYWFEGTTRVEFTNKLNSKKVLANVLR